jgi:FAD synthetase
MGSNQHPIKKIKHIVLVGGVFDILHYGHVHFLREAKKLGDKLVIALESDKNVKKIKGDSRPFHNQNQRREILESLNFVDEVIILKESMSDEDYKNLALEIQPDIIAVTAGDPVLDKKQAHARTVLAEIVEIPKIQVSSTTQIAKLLELE